MYNIGETVMQIGTKHKEESRRKMSIARKGSKFTKIHKERIGIGIARAWARRKENKTKQEAREHILS